MKILVIRLSSIGDVVLTTPVLRCLKEQLPGCEIHYVVKKSFAPVLEGNPHIDKIHHYHNNMRQLLVELRKEKFDHIVDLHKNYRSWLIRTLIPGKTSTFQKRNLEKWLMVNVNVTELPINHVAERYFEATEPLGVKHDGKGGEYFIPEAAQKITSELPWPSGEKYVAVVAGGRYVTKQIPADKLGMVCSQLNAPVALLGGPEDIAYAESIMQLAGRNEGLVNLCGKISLNESAAVINGSSCVVTPDTGMMHIAAALNKKVVSVWGNTTPELGMYAYFGTPEKNREMSKIIENPRISCRPCSKLGHTECPKGHFLCMNSLAAKDIVSAVDAFLQT